MIPQAFITAWRKNAPWQDDFQVEQNLVIERAFMSIYDSMLSNPVGIQAKF